MRRTADDIGEIGKALIHQKQALGHSNFLRWVAAEFEMTDRTARRFMDVAAAYGSKTDTASDLDR